jgi:hypothetical protein
MTLIPPAVETALLNNPSVSRYITGTLSLLLNWKQERGAAVSLQDKALHLTSSSVPFVAAKEVIWTKQ